MRQSGVEYTEFPTTPSAAPDADYEVANRKFVLDNAGMTNPMTTAGDIIYGGTDGAPTRLAKGTAAQVLKMNSGATAPEWAAESAAGKLIVEDNGFGLDNGSTGRGTVGSNAVSLEYSSSGSTYGATGASSHAEGSFTTASGASSHAEGNNTISSGLYAHAEGTVSVASGNISHAEGSTTTASGSASHSEGTLTVASNSFTHAEGYYSLSSHYSEHAHASGRFSTNGDCQTGRVQARIATSSTDAAILYLDGTSQIFSLLDGDGYTCRITFFGKQADGSIGDAVYQVKIKREGTTTSLSGTVRTILAWEGDTNLGTPTIAITADDTNEALQIAVTPANATATRWTASVEYVKINY